MSQYADGMSSYGDLGVDAEAAIARAVEVPISIHCWQGDDVTGFEQRSSEAGSGGIMAIGGYPGRARSGDELRQDYEKVLSLVPGVHRANLHAMYAEPEGKAVARDELLPEHFARWMDWARSRGIGLDFNPTYFAHPMAASGFTLSSRDADVRAFWIRHGIACRKIAASMATIDDRQSTIANHWIPDGAKDSPADRWSPRARLIDSYEQIFAEPVEACLDSVESKLFGLGSEDYVVGSYEFYSHYALERDLVFCLDMGHFHPTETIADKLSALLQFHKMLLIHVSRPLRWDSDHVVIFNDDLRAVFQELVRGKALDRILLALDFFDASINRIAAYVIGIRAVRKALLYALLEPFDLLQTLELEGKLAQKLALMEECKTLPFGSVWEELCGRADVHAGRAWIEDVELYERNVLAAR